MVADGRPAWHAAATTAHRSAAVIRRGRPGREASCRPGSPLAFPRRHHLRTVAGWQPSSRAVARIAKRLRARWPYPVERQPSGSRPRRLWPDRLNQCQKRPADSHPRPMTPSSNRVACVCRTPPTVQPSELVHRRVPVLASRLASLPDGRFVALGATRVECASTRSIGIICPTFGGRLYSARGGRADGRDV